MITLHDHIKNILANHSHGRSTRSEITPRYDSHQSRNSERGLIKELPLILTTIFNTQFDNSTPEQSPVPRWLDRIDMRKQQLRDYPFEESKNTSSFSLFKLRKTEDKVSKQLAHDTYCHNFYWCASLEMLSLMMDIDGPSLAQLCYRCESQELHALLMQEVLPQSSVNLIVNKDFESLRELYHNLCAPIED